MNGEPTRKSPQHDSDYDGAWKEAMREHLSVCIEKYFPAAHAAIDWKYDAEWYDKELSQILGEPGRRNQAVDMLVKVRLKTGEEQWILLHLEIQGYYEEDFPERISLYNSGFHWIFKHRVMSLVILADLRRDWEPNEDVFAVGGFESRLKFPVCKLINRLETDWKDDHSLPVLLARAQIEALRTAGDPEARYQAKWKLVRRLYDLGYNAQQVRELFRLIDWMMHLREDLEKQFDLDLTKLEEERTMPYVTSVERVGLANVYMAQLAELFGEAVPEKIEWRIRALPFEKLERLGPALMHFKSVTELSDWLDQHTNSGE